MAIEDTISDAIDDATTGAVDGTFNEFSDTHELGQRETTAVDPATTSPSEVDQELAAQGIRAPIEGQRENRLPHTRVKKIVENALRRLTEKHTKEIQTHQTQAQHAQERLRNMDAVDRLIATDPERYIGMLAALHPQYRRYTQSGSQQPQQQQQQSKAPEDPRPEPDAEYSDGSKGYSPAGVDRLLEWKSRQVESRVMATVDKRFGPLEQQWRREQQEQQMRPQIQRQIQMARQTWGKLFEDDYRLGPKSEIVRFMQANPAIPFEAAAAYVLVPKTQAQKDMMRADILKEMNARPKAAAKGAPAAVAAAGESKGRTIEDIIREQIAASGLPR